MGPAAASAVEASATGHTTLVEVTFSPACPLWQLPSPSHSLGGRPAPSTELCPSQPFHQPCKLNISIPVSRDSPGHSDLSGSQPQGSKEGCPGPEHLRGHVPHSGHWAVLRALPSLLDVMLLGLGLFVSFHLLLNRRYVATSVWAAVDTESLWSSSSRI